MKQISIDFTKALVSKQELSATQSKLASYGETLRAAAIDRDYASPESSLFLPFDKKIHREVSAVAQTLSNPKLKFIVVIGIGGSNLGTQAIYEAIYGPHREYWSPRMLFADTVSPRLIQTILWLVTNKKNISSAKEIVINLISKSGTTTESIANFEVLFAGLKSIKGIRERVVITTDEGSKLWHAAREQGFQRLAIPAQVGGRFSVFSSVGLLPLMLAYIRVDDLLKGAATMVDRCLNSKVSPAALSASLLFLQGKDNLINNNFFFNPELESLGKWYRQLMGESIGKERDAAGKIVHAGMVPLVSIGSTDLHSMAQLYFGGPRRIFHTLIYSPQQADSPAVPKNLLYTDLVNGIAGKKLSAVMEAILGGVEAAYQKNRIPYMKISLPEIHESTLGQYLQFKMIEMMMLAKLMHLNAFDQPNVEEYKAETRRLLLG